MIATTRFSFLVLVATSAALNACAAKARPAPPAATPAAAAAATTIDLPDGTDPNGIFWNAATHTLIVADDDGNRLLAWKEGAGWSPLAPLPPSGSAHPGLGQPVQLADGTLVVTRFGGGTDGDVAVLRADGTSSVVPNLDKARRRIGLTCATDGKLYDSYFVKTDTGRAGGVSQLDLTKGETDLVSNLRKPVGVLGVGASLYIADQDSGKLLKSALPSPFASAPLAPVAIATLPPSDLLSEGPGGAILTGGKDGRVHAIDAQGKVTVLASGFTEVRGIAYDSAAHRIFFVDHMPPKGGKKSALLIRPVP